MEKRFDMIQGKQRARARLREFIVKHIHSYKNARVLCLPGEHGREIESVYRKLGFQDRNIVGLESNEGAVQGVREHYPRITTVHSTVEDYSLGLASSDNVEPFNVISLDYCGVFTSSRVEFLSNLAACGAFADRVIIAVNFFAGRETDYDQRIMRQNLWVEKARRTDPSDPGRYEQSLKDAIDAPLKEARDISASSFIENLITRVSAYLKMQKSPVFKDCLRFDPDRLSPLVGSSYDGIVSLEDREKARRLLDDNLMLFSLDTIVTRLELLIGNSYVQLKDPPVFSGGAELNYNIRNLATNIHDAMLVKHGPGYVCRDVERYSYINDQGHRMLSDFLYFRRVDDLKKDTLPNCLDVIDGYLDIDPQISDLDPEPLLLFFEFLVAMFFPLVKGEVGQEGYPLRIDLGGGSSHMDDAKVKDRVVRLLQKGRSDDEIMARYPVTIGTLRAYKAHVTMGTYEKV